MITKKNIDKMLEMPDERMAAMLRIVLSAAGVDPSALSFDEKSVKKLRAVLGELTEHDLERIGALAESWRRGG